MSFNLSFAFGHSDADPTPTDFMPPARAASIPVSASSTTKLVVFFLHHYILLLIS